MRRHLSGIRLILPLVLLGLAATLLCGFVGFKIARQSDAVGLENQRAMVRAGLLEFRSAYGESDRVDPRLLEMVAQFSGLSELKFETDPITNDDMAEPVLTMQGRIAGFLTWPRETPLTSFMLRLSPLVGAIVIGLIGFAGVSARELHRARQQLALSEKHAREAIEQDALTGLYGHDKMMILLDAALTAQSEQGVVTYALLALRGVDVLIENSGQSASNEVIAAAAANLREALPAGAICGRAGAHEFAMMWTGLDDPEAVLRAAIDAVTRPHWIENVVHVAAHAGFAQAPRDARSREDLARRAERALRVAAKNGAGTIIAFDHDIDVAAAEEQFIRRELPRALAAQALDVHYQPIVAANGSGICRRRGAAALDPFDPRRRFRRRVFVPVAEQMGLMETLGAFVLRARAGRGEPLAEPLHRGQPVAGAGARPRHSSIWCAARWKKPALRRRALVLEITEGVLIDNPDEVRKRIAGSARARRAHRARRFRLRLFRARLSAALSVRQAQDRPQLRRRARPLGEWRRDHPGDRRARPRARPSRCWRKASRPRSSGCCCGWPAATRCRASCSRGPRLPRQIDELLASSARALARNPPPRDSADSARSAAYRVALRGFLPERRLGVT